MLAKQIARGGMITGLSIILLYAATFLSFASWTVCMLIGFLPALFFLVGQKRVGVLVYAATSALALFLLPDKSIAILYAGLFGLYTVLHFYIGHLQHRIARWIVKLLFANFWVAAILWCIRIGLIPDLPILSSRLSAIAVIMGNLILIYYDLCLSRIFLGMRGFAQRFHNL